MAKVSKVRCKSDSHRQRMRSLLSSCPGKSVKDCRLKEKHCKASEKKDWEGATCSVCLEYPHNAVLLLCSSYNKGCRPYMCATSSRFSNCLKQYTKAYTKLTPIEGSQQWNQSIDNPTFSLVEGRGIDKTEISELLCPLCRGQVKGWTVVEPVRKYLNAKKRTCMQDKCSYVGSYKQLRKHVRAKHPLARPREVDPVLEEKWRKLEFERERNDIISTIMTSTPGAVVLGDYVLEPGHHSIYDDYDSDESLEEEDGPFHLGPFDQRQGSGLHFHGWDDFELIDYAFDERRFGRHRAEGAVSGRFSHALGGARRRWGFRGEFTRRNY